jgi:hypothetical protein
MGVTRKDSAAAALTALAVLAFLANRWSWDVALVGGSVRWAAAAVFLCGMLTCMLGSPGRGVSSVVLGGLGTLALALAAAAIALASAAALAALAVVIVVLWAAATARHATGPIRPAALR